MKDKEITQADRQQNKKTAPSGIESDTALCRRKDGCYRFYNPAL